MANEDPAGLFAVGHPRSAACGLVRAASDLVTARPDLSAQRISLIVLLGAATDQIVAARGIAAHEPVALIGAIGRTVLASFLPNANREPHSDTT